MSVVTTELPTQVVSDAIRKLEIELVAAHGELQRSRLRRGLNQVAQFWRADDGDISSFQDFVRSNFAGDPATFDALFQRFESLLEQLDGHMHEIMREFRQQLDLDRGPLLPLDEVFGGYDPSAHVSDDFFENKLAFVVLLNFPLATLDERLQQGASWNRRQWAEVRLAQRFSARVPADVKLSIAQAEAESGRYISEYNLWMHHILTPDGRRLFPPGMHLLSHWGLRDELKANYADGENGLRRQRLIQQIMERVVTQTIPEAVINNPAVDWNPVTNRVLASDVSDGGSPAKVPSAVHATPEPDTRYRQLLKTFHASRLADPYWPAAPSLIARRFQDDREIPEERVRQMLEQVLTSPLVPRVGRLIEARLGRRLEPFDIWYSGFRSGDGQPEEELDELIRRKYPSALAFRQDIPNLLLKLGFSAERARYLAERIAVDPARGAGHAMGAEMRSAKSHLRTRIAAGGMDYKGFNVAVHELGHNVEQVFSIYDVDYTLLRGVPNTAFTEAFAFLFQARDLELLGLPGSDAASDSLRVLNHFWGTFEIAGVSLVDMAVWHWMYDHPQAGPAQLKEAVLDISKDVWNRYHASVFRRRDVVLLGIYSHMIDAFLYLPDYPIGHLISFQIEEYLRNTGVIGPEFERMAKMGRVTPDLWMKHATGQPVGPEALLAAADKALTALGAG
jgi:hypothetical protein